MIKFLILVSPPSPLSFPTRAIMNASFFFFFFNFFLILFFILNVNTEKHQSRLRLTI